MATNIRYIVIIALIFFVFSCDKVLKNENAIEIKNDAYKITDTTNINGILLELIDRNGKGELKVHSKNNKIDGEIIVGAPCNFLRYDGKVISHKYPDVNADDVILFVGKSGIQPIIFKKDSILYTDYYLTTEIFEHAPDEIMYYQFAHQKHQK